MYTKITVPAYSSNYASVEQLHGPKVKGIPALQQGQTVLCLTHLSLIEALAAHCIALQCRLLPSAANIFLLQTWVQSMQD